MPIVTADDVVLLTETSKTAGDIEETGIIATVTERVRTFCHNDFSSDSIYLASAVTFNATAGTIVAGSSYVTAGFAAGDEIRVSGSYRNDKYLTIASVSTTTITIATAESVVAELSGATVTVSLVDWPDDIPYAAAQLVKYDLDDRPTRGAGITSQTLGPRSESYSERGTFGYPEDLLALFDEYRRPTFG